ncbi:MAG TPA: hypothetical protein VM325_10025 [Alphaproteobacteria bacterium]|nr:hypothetical protein [Alphaproteobacteria bacterium]
MTACARNDGHHERDAARISKADGADGKLDEAFDETMKAIMVENRQSGRDEMKDSDLEKPARRNLLRGLFLGAAAATTAGLTSGTAQAASPETDDASGGYQDSDHVRRYYALADD